ncbi:DUF6011 domain-containing protein [Mycolicibacterium komossense]
MTASAEELKPEDEEQRIAVRCKVCGSWLTDPASVALRIGPKCSRHGGVH